jgi:hypothetical protein
LGGASLGVDVGVTGDEGGLGQLGLGDEDRALISVLLDDESKVGDVGGDLGLGGFDGVEHLGVSLFTG